MNSRKLTLWTIPVALTLMSSPLAVAKPLGDKDTAIKIAINEWTGQNLTAHIAGKLLEKLGYKVEYVTAGTLPQFTGIANGTLAVSPEVWPSNLGDVYPKAKAEGKLEEIGELGLQSRDGWVYTADTKAACPELPDWSALKDPACVQALATPETFPNGRLLDYPADWGSVSGAELKKFDIPFTPVPAGSEGALVAELQAAVAAHKPLLMRFWSPHWVLAETPVEWLKMPPCDAKDLAECIVAPPVIKVVWAGFAQKWPAGYEMMKSLQLHADDQQKMIYAVDKQGKNLDQAVDDWLDQHQGDWQAWLKAAQD
ncbi:ABC transporter substrate-binding protein [Mesorhizobium sp. CA7]|uniref:ABC transporter substrate-binding protein n=1 Tax=Mesorhizobium sp. CA7 TaxID=588501 RepID=UPI001CCBA2A4|nr:ABC transporter substrate-binding protein [Mesorhizobium sp. CA7]MBZ9813842.1 ABC transporter substrate-binding protein [Mesorhizobium sp. CA7]